MNYRVKYISTFLLSWIVLQLQAQIISVQTKLSSDSMMIGDQLLFTIHVESAREVSFRMPLVTDTLTRDVEVLAPFGADTAQTGDGGWVIDHSYIITGFEPGLKLIPAQPVIYTFNSTTDTALSMPLLFQVHAPAVDTSQHIKPIKPPLNTPLTLKEIIPFVALGIMVWLAGTLIFALIWMYRQRRRDPEIFSNRPLEPAHIVAFRELDALKEKKLWESGQVKLYYTELTEITRRYIERQYGIPALERTTFEILQAFQRSNTEDPLLDEMLKDLLELADLVKFAKEDPLPLENQTNLNNAYLFVQKTFPMFLEVKLEESKITEEENHG
jgi:hypothetical protein